MFQPNAEKLTVRRFFFAVKCRIPRKNTSENSYLPVTSTLNAVLFETIYLIATTNIRNVMRSLNEPGQICRHNNEIIIILSKSRVVCLYIFRLKDIFLLGTIFDAICFSKIAQF
jgi:hypothetical protein